MSRKLKLRRLQSAFAVYKERQAHCEALKVCSSMAVWAPVSVSSRKSNVTGPPVAMVVMAAVVW